jgi:hypothetical protein
MKTVPSIQFFKGNPNLNFVQREVGRANHGQIDAAKLNLSFFHCLFVLTLPDLPLLRATCKVASTLATALPWQLGGSKLTQLCYQVTRATFASVVHVLHFACS